MSDNTRRRIRSSIRFLIGALVAVLLLGYTLYARLVNHGSEHYQINIFVPWGLMAVLISFYLFSEVNRVKKAKRDEKREYMNERRQEIIDNVIKAKNKESDTKNE